MGSLLRSGRPRWSSQEEDLEDLVSSKNVKATGSGAAPRGGGLLYLQSWKLVFAVYHMVTTKVSRFDRYQSECIVPWINVLWLLTVALQAGQQLKEASSTILSQYKQEININQRKTKLTVNSK